MDKAEGKWRQRDKGMYRRMRDWYSCVFFYIGAKIHEIFFKDDTQQSRLEFEDFFIYEYLHISYSSKMVRRKKNGMDLITLNLLKNSTIN
jgi:hypothetical protein